MKGGLRKIGGFHPMDSEGYLLNPCRRENVRGPWEKAVRELREALLGRLGDAIHSLYLRGSVPRGEAIDGVSDLDLLAVLSREISPSDREWLREYRREFLAGHRFVANLETQLVGKEALLRETGFLSYRFILKHLSLCISGEDLAAQIPALRPGRRIAYAFHFNIREEIEKTRDWMGKGPPERAVRLGCVWIMKRLVRCGFAIFMEEEKAYTRDLYPCYEVFAKHHPEKEPEMRRALEWAVQPTTDAAAIADFLGSFGRWLADRAFQAFYGEKT